MKNPKPILLSRRDFLKLSGTASLGLALSACGITQVPTATPPIISTLTPTNTSTPTLTSTQSPSPTPEPRTLRSVGEGIGLLFGTAFDETSASNLDWYNPDFQEAVKTHFSIVEPEASFLPPHYGYHAQMIKRAKENRRRITEAGQIFFIQPGLWSEDRLSLKNASKEQIIEFAEKRVRYFFQFVEKVSTGAKPTYMYLLNEILWETDYKGGDESGWFPAEENPYFAAWGNRMIIEAYLMYTRIAKEMGLEIGKDYRLIYNDYNTHRPNAKVRKAAHEVDRARTEIAKIQGATPADVLIDVGMECRFWYSRRPWFAIPPPTEEQLRQVVRAFKKVADRVHFTEATIIGADSPKQIMDTLRMLNHVALEEGVASITYWKGMLPVGAKDPDVKSTGPTAESLGLFDSQARTTDAYDTLVRDLLEMSAAK